MPFTETRIRTKTLQGFKEAKKSFYFRQFPPRKVEKGQEKNEIKSLEGREKKRRAKRKAKRMKKERERKSEKERKKTRVRVRENGRERGKKERGSF